MLKVYRDRAVTYGEKYRVYRNLNNQLFSLLALTGEYKGKVVAHSSSVKLEHVKFIVSEASRQRACRENTRNVHAFAEGHLASAGEKYDVSLMQGISYNPFKYSHFYLVENRQSIVNAESVVLADGKAFGLRIELTS